MLEQELAEKVVTAFKSELNSDALNCITESQFHLSLN